jgi:hypothetical protein
MRAAPWLVAALVTLGGALYAGRTIDHQWVPHDEGALAQSAERTAHGQLPHRDFDELYTGGLTQVNALAFRVLGVRLTVLRVVLMIALVLWLPAVYYVASRFTGSFGAAVVTILALVWSVPNYPAAMPSWYNLFFAVFALAAWCRFLETETEPAHRGWLLACGLAIGFSICTKIIGLYLGGAMALAIAFHEQTRSARDPVPGPGARAFSLLLMFSAALLVPAVLGLITALDAPELIHFVLPAALVSLVLIVRERRSARGAAVVRLRRLLALAVPVAVGAAIPIALFLVPYVAHGAMHDLLLGVFVRPTRRLARAAFDLPTLAESWPSLVLAVALALPLVLSRRAQWVASAIVAVPFGLYLATWIRHPSLYLLPWDAARATVPLVVLCGAALLIVMDRDGRLDPRRADQLYALLAAAALCSLVQFPFSAAIYFCYVAPLAVLAILAVLTAGEARPGPLPLTIALCFALFAIVTMNGQSLHTLGARSAPRLAVVPLGLPRGDLSVPVSDAEMYRRVVALIDAHAAGSRFAYAAPDAPEVTFLAGLGNPTPTLFDVFDDSAGSPTAVLAALRRHNVRAIAINTEPQFSTAIRGALDSALRASYPDSEEVDRFTVRWRP